MTDATAPRTARAAVLSNSRIAPGFYRMTLEFSGGDQLFHPGPFFQLRIRPDELDPPLRRPSAPSEAYPDFLAFVYAIVGRGTDLMTRLAGGNEVDLLCPLGRGYSLPDPATPTDAVLVGGGCGGPSLLHLARTLRAAGHGVHMAIGARTEAGLLETPAAKEIADRTLLATDDGSAGLRGHAVAAAEQLLDDLAGDRPVRLYACGPTPMLRGVATLAAARGIPCEVSLEARMACGFGVCNGCVVRTVDPAAEDGFAYRKVCVDGPVFAAGDLIWE